MSGISRHPAALQRRSVRAQARERVLVAAVSLSLSLSMAALLRIALEVLA